MILLFAVFPLWRLCYDSNDKNTYWEWKPPLLSEWDISQSRYCARVGDEACRGENSISVCSAIYTKLLQYAEHLLWKPSQDAYGGYQRSKAQNIETASLADTRATVPGISYISVGFIRLENHCHGTKYFITKTVWISLGSVFDVSFSWNLIESQSDQFANYLNMFAWSNIQRKQTLLVELDVIESSVAEKKNQDVTKPNKHEKLSTVKR